MVTTKTKKKPVIRNLRKIKVLLFLMMRKETGDKWATAREIAIATGGNADSLYVLLQRWSRWGLVNCMPGRLYAYSIADEGERYLGKIDNWFFKGYYSKKHKKRIPGYRGKIEDLKREIAIASKAIVWWRFTPDRRPSRSDEVNRGIAYYIKAPFNTADDFVKLEGSEGRGVKWNGDNLLIVEVDNAFEAYKIPAEWGCEEPLGKAKLGQAIVDAKLGMIWKKDNA